MILINLTNNKYVHLINYDIDDTQFSYFGLSLILEINENNLENFHSMFTKTKEDLLLIDNDRETLTTGVFITKIDVVDITKITTSVDSFTITSGYKEMVKQIVRDDKLKEILEQ